MALVVGVVGLFVYSTQRAPDSDRSREYDPSPALRFATVADAEKAAVQRYPDLGILGSKLNAEFVARYNLYQRTRPEYFSDVAWPVRLAEELVENGKAN